MSEGARAALADSALSQRVQQPAGPAGPADSRALVALLALSFVGAAGLAARPLYRSAFAARAAREQAIQLAARAARREAGAGRLQVALARLGQIELAHRLRHPLLYLDRPPSGR